MEPNYQVMNTQKVEAFVGQKLAGVVRAEQGNFGIRTNEMTFNKEEIARGKFNTPDYLLSINGRKVVLEITTASDLEKGRKRGFGSYNPAKFCDSELPDLVSLRISDKIAKNLNRVDDFDIPIIFILGVSDNSSFIDETQVKIFVETPTGNSKYILVNTPKTELISAIIWCKFSNDLNQILDVKAFSNFPSTKNRMDKTALEQIETLLRHN